MLPPAPLLFLASLISQEEGKIVHHYQSLETNFEKRSARAIFTLCGRVDSSNKARGAVIYCEHRVSFVEGGKTAAFFSSKKN